MTVARTVSRLAGIAAAGVLLLRRGTDGRLLAVSVVGANDGWAVGLREDPKLGRRPLVLHDDGQAAWSEVPSPADPAELHHPYIAVGSR